MSMDHKEDLRSDSLVSSYAKDPGIAPECRDSSVDSGFFHSSPPSPPFSDTDSEIVETLNRKSSVTKSTTFQDAEPETDNLVEEVYVAEDSWHHVGGIQESDFSQVNPPPYSEEGKYHAKVFIPEDTTSSEELSCGEETSQIKPSEVLSCSDINKNKFTTFNISSRYLNYNNRPVNTNELNTVLNKEFFVQDERYYVNQAELGLLKSLNKIVVEDNVSEERFHGVVVVAVDLGTTYSGYAFRYTRHPTDKEIHIMRKWEGGDPGLNNQKTPTILLLNPQQQFHSFGFAARDFFHDLEPEDAKKWFYFDKFKKHLHNRTDINRETTLVAANGIPLSGLVVFSHALRYLAQQALSELSDHGTMVSSGSVRWVITVPAVWSHSAKQFIREAAYMAEICNTNQPEQLVIALEPEAAAIWCRNLYFSQLEQQLQGQQNPDSSFMVVDCGGGTVDITVHKITSSTGTLREIYKATGDPSGSLGVDDEFERLLESIFGQTFMTHLRRERPAAYIELMLSFETRKRSATPDRSSTFNIFLPFAFIEFHRIITGKDVSQVISDFGQNITWSPQGMLRIPPDIMKKLFSTTLESILKHVEAVLAVPEVEAQIKQVFLVGGFAESKFLQDAFRNKLLSLGHASPIIPQGVALSILRGAVLFGLDSKTVSVRKAQHTYGIGVLKPFLHGKHPLDKLVVKDEQHWCADIFDTLVITNQTMRVGEATTRRYTPANPLQTVIVLHIYCTDATSAMFVTDEGVRKVGTLKLDISQNNNSNKPREILTRILFSSTEVSVSALDVETSNCVETDLNFMPQ